MDSLRSYNWKYFDKISLKFQNPNLKYDANHVQTPLGQNIIASSGPSYSSAGVFWKLVIEKNVKLVVCLTKTSSNKSGYSCYNYLDKEVWPVPNTSETIEVDPTNEIQLYPSLIKRTFIL